MEMTQQQIKILEGIVNNSLRIISYKHPEKQLGDVAKNYNETINILGSFERDFQGLAKFDPKIKFSWFDRGGYKIDLEKAEKLYMNHSVKKE